MCTISWTWACGIFYTIIISYSNTQNVNFTSVIFRHGSWISKLCTQSPSLAIFWHYANREPNYIVVKYWYKVFLSCQTKWNDMDTYDMICFVRCMPFKSICLFWMVLWISNFSLEAHFWLDAFSLISFSSLISLVFVFVYVYWCVCVCDWLWNGINLLGVVEEDTSKYHSHGPDEHVVH